MVHVHVYLCIHVHVHEYINMYLLKGIGIIWELNWSNKIIEWIVISKLLYWYRITLINWQFYFFWNETLYLKAKGPFVIRGGSKSSFKIRRSLIWVNNNLIINYSKIKFVYICVWSVDHLLYSIHYVLNLI